MGTPRIDGTFTSGQPAVVGSSPQGPALAVFNNLLYIPGPELTIRSTSSHPRTGRTSTSLHFSRTRERCGVSSHPAWARSELRSLSPRQSERLRRDFDELSQPALAHEGRRNQLPRLGGAEGEHRATLSHCCHQHPIFVTDPGLLVPQLSLLIPFLSLRRAALYKEEEKGKRNFLGLVACEKKNKFLAAQPGASSPPNTGKKAGLRT
jgi:hypothetical protein